MWVCICLCKDESLSGNVCLNSTADSKLLEDILVSGSQLVFQKHKGALMMENQDNTNLSIKKTKSQDSVASESAGYKNSDEPKSRSKGLMGLVNSVLGIDADGQQKLSDKSGAFDTTNGKVMWRIRGINPSSAAVDAGMSHMTILVLWISMGTAISSSSCC